MTNTHSHAVYLSSYNMDTKQDVTTVLSKHKSADAARKAFNKQAKMGRPVSFGQIEASK